MAELEARRKARKARQEAQASRESFPAHLQRRDRVLDLSDEQKVGLKLIATKVFERLRFEKPTVYVERVLRHVYVKGDVVDPASSPVIAAPALPSIVEGCKYDFSIVAAVVGMKFAFHMPTYREQDFFGQSGWHPSRSTSNDLINHAVTCIDPLFAQVSHCLMQQPILFGDATVLTVLLRDELSLGTHDSVVPEHEHEKKPSGAARHMLNPDAYIEPANWKAVAKSDFASWITRLC